MAIRFSSWDDVVALFYVFDDNGNISPVCRLWLLLHEMIEKKKNKERLRILLYRLHLLVMNYFFLVSSGSS